jgi:hypothetical protein
MADVRVDLERLKKLSKRVKVLENRIHKLESEKETMHDSIAELRNTVRGLAHHMEFQVELTPTGRIDDPTSPGFRRCPVRNEKDVDVMLDTAIPDDEDMVEAELPDSRLHWTPKER